MSVFFSISLSISAMSKSSELLSIGTKSRKSTSLLSGFETVAVGCVFCFLGAGTISDLGLSMVS